MTATEIKIAVAVVQIAGPAANGVFGIPSAEELETAFQAVIDDLNRSGGVACRKLIPTYYRVNPVDQSSMQEQCLEIAESGAYAVLDTGAMASQTTNPLTCFAQHRVPYFGGSFMPEWLAQQHWPYLFAANAFEPLARDTALALKDLGFFDPAKGFKKLGFFYRSCDEHRRDAYTSALQRAGLAEAQIVRYDFGCPAGFASPGDVTQAILKFQQNGVTHVTEIGAVGDLSTFTKVAEQQRFRPKYGFPDESLVQISYGSQRPEPANIAGAIAITQSRNGDDRTPGTVRSPGTVRCDAIYTARQLPTTYEEPTTVGSICSLVWMVHAAIAHAPSMEATSLGAGLQRAKSVELSFPRGPNDFTAPRTTTGGQFWRAVQFMAGCECWQLTDHNFRPRYR